MLNVGLDESSLGYQPWRSQCRNILHFSKFHFYLACWNWVDDLRKKKEQMLLDYKFGTTGWDVSCVWKLRHLLILSSLHSPSCSIKLNTRIKMVRWRCVKNILKNLPGILAWRFFVCSYQRRHRSHFLSSCNSLCLTFTFPSFVSSCLLNFCLKATLNSFGSHGRILVLMSSGFLAIRISISSLSFKSNRLILSSRTFWASRKLQEAAKSPLWYNLQGLLQKLPSPNKKLHLFSLLHGQ